MFLHACLHVFVCVCVCTCGLCQSSGFYSSIRLPSVVCDRLVILIPIEKVEESCSSSRTCGGTSSPSPVFAILHIQRIVHTWSVELLLRKVSCVCVAVWCSVCESVWVVYSSHFPFSSSESAESSFCIAAYEIK